MQKGKFQSKTTRHIRGSARSISLILAVMLLIGCVVGGTVAWLVDETEAVVNTFTYGDINITLEETDTDLDGDNNPNTNQYEMIPGSKLTKDPVITVKQGSESSYVFVKLEKSENFDDFLTYEIADGWTELSNENDTAVYYTEVTAEQCKDADVQFGVLKDNQVTVRGEVTKEQLNELDKAGAEAAYPTLTITAYAVQKENIATAAEAWAIANPPETPAETTATTETTA